MNGLIAEFRHALAVYRSTPLASAIAVVALAAAMAFVSAFLAMWSDLSLKGPVGFEQGGELVTIGQSGGYAVADSSRPLTLDLVESIDDVINSLEHAAGVATLTQWLELEDRQVSVQAEAVTGYFSELRPRLFLGRPFEFSDHVRDAEPVVILSFRSWQNHFGGRTEVLGERLRLTQPLTLPPALAAQVSELPEPTGQDYQIVGVMSPQMNGTFSDTTDVWLPYEQVVPVLFGQSEDEQEMQLGTAQGIRTSNVSSNPTRMRGVARLANGASATAAENELNERLSLEGQALSIGLTLSGEEMRFDVLEGLVRDIGVQRESRRQVRLFLAGTLLLVIVSACNISLFLLARASRRQRELGIRMSVGASARRLARQLFGEASVLILISTALGLIFSFWVSSALRELPFLQQAEWENVSPFDWRVLAMLAGLMLLLSVIVSMAPILGLRRMGIGASSSVVSASAGWGQRLAGTVQIALTAVVGAVAIAFVWHLIFYAMADRGFDAGDVLVVEVERNPGVLGQITSLQAAVAERQRRHDVIARLPGVEDASFASAAPGGAGEMAYTIIQRESGRYVEIANVNVDENYINVLDIPLLYGSNQDPLDPLQIIGNVSYALDTYGRVDIVGERRPSGYVIVGIVNDIAFGHPSEAVPPMGLTNSGAVDYPLLLVETGLSPVALRALLQQKVETGELEMRFGDIRRLSEIAGQDLRPDRARAAFTAISALLVVVLAAFGFYGTQRYLITAGQREYAIRSALGAGPRALGSLVIRRSYALGMPGLVLGSVLALIAVAWLRDEYVTAAVSPFSVVIAISLAVSLLILAATISPIRQARAIAPAVLLRDAG